MFIDHKALVMNEAGYFKSANLNEHKQLKSFIRSKMNNYVRMKKKFVVVFCVSILLECGMFILYGQNDSIKKVPYNQDFRFKEGIYLNFEQVKSNNPISKSRVITNIDFNNAQFFDNVLSGQTFSYYDQLGLKRDVAVNAAWGYSKNGLIFVRMDKVYNRISYIGSISHFIATIVSYNSRNYDPYYYNPYYYYRGGGMPSSYSSNEMRQFILDFDSGKIMDYDEESIEVLLMKDPELHDEYMALSKKKKSQLKFVYIRKFNERNPLMIPLN